MATAVPTVKISKKRNTDPLGYRAHEARYAAQASTVSNIDMALRKEGDSNVNYSKEKGAGQASWEKNTCCGVLFHIQE